MLHRPGKFGNQALKQANKASWINTHRDLSTTTDDGACQDE
jgi:hypothetical protein